MGRDEGSVTRNGRRDERQLGEWMDGGFEELPLLAHTHWKPHKSPHTISAPSSADPANKRDGERWAGGVIAEQAERMTTTRPFSASGDAM